MLKPKRIFQNVRKPYLVSNLKPKTFFKIKSSIFFRSSDSNNIKVYSASGDASTSSSTQGASTPLPSELSTEQQQVLFKMLNKYQLTSSELDSVKKITPSALSAALKLVGTNQGLGLLKIQQNDIVEISMQFKFKGIREVNTKTYAGEQGMLRSPINNTELFNQNQLTKKTKCYFIINKAEGEKTFLDLADLIGQKLWTKHIAHMCPNSVTFEVASFKIVYPPERKTPSFSKGMVLNGTANCSLDMVSMRPFVFLLTSPFIFASKKDHGIRLAFINKAYEDNGQKLQQTLKEIPTKLAELLRGDITFDNDNSFVIRLAIRTNQASSPLTYYPVNWVDPIGFLANTGSSRIVPSVRLLKRSNSQPADPGSVASYNGGNSSGGVRGRYGVTSFDISRGAAGRVAAGPAPATTARLLSDDNTYQPISDLVGGASGAGEFPNGDAGANAAVVRNAPEGVDFVIENQDDLFKQTRGEI
jgi:hypothetical protein